MLQPTSTALLIRDITELLPIRSRLNQRVVNGRAFASSELTRYFTFFGMLRPGDLVGPLANSARLFRVHHRWAVVFSRA